MAKNFFYKSKYILIFISVVLLVCAFVLNNVARWEIDSGVYLFFTTAYLGLLVVSFFPPFSEFFTLVNVFFFLGFWFKITYHVVAGIILLEPTGRFSIEDLNRALILSSYGAFALIVIQIIIKKVFSIKSSSTYDRIVPKRVLFLMIPITVFLCLLNWKLGFLRVGIPSSTSILFPVSLIFSWFLGPGAAFLGFLFSGKKLSLLKTFIVSISMMGISISTLSRNSLMYFAYPVFIKFFSSNEKVFTRMLHSVVILGVFLFTLRIVTPLRIQIYEDYNIKFSHFLYEGDSSIFKSGKTILNTENRHHMGTLFIDRWVGIEGMIVATVNRSDELFKTLITEDSKSSPETAYRKISHSHYPEPGRALLYAYPGPLGLILMAKSSSLVVTGFLFFGLILWLSYFLIEKYLQGSVKSIVCWWAAVNVTQLSLFPMQNVPVYLAYLFIMTFLSILFHKSFQKR